MATRTKSKALNATAAAQLPRIDEYFGAWGIEPTRGMAMFNQIRSMDLQAHIQQTDKPTPSEKLNANMVPMPQIPPGQMDDDDDEPTAPGIAIFEVNGVLMKQESSLGDSTSYVALRRQVRQAMDDSNCMGAMLCIDSPGGSVAGCSDLMADLKAFAAAKPLVAFAEDLAASCGYRIACAAAEIYANCEEAKVGCIGTFIGLYDSSEAAKKEGIKAKVYATGPLKGAGFPGAEVTEEQDKYFQNMVDETQKYFAADVASARKMTPEAVSAVATGGCFMAKEAIKLGLINGIKSYEDCLARVAEMVSASGAGVTMEAHMSATPSPAPAAPASAVEVQKPTGKEYVEAFGAQGALWFVEGKAFSECVGLHREQVEKEMKALRESNAALTTERDQLKARVLELRGGDPVSPAIASDAKVGKTDVSSLENRIGKNLAAVAKSITLPKAETKAA